MIETLRIEQLALVEALEVAFDPGLNVLTGETGAGKSIVLGALALLAGGRAQADTVREGAQEAVVEAVFGTAELPELEASLAEMGLEAEGHELIVRRSVSRAGRGRAWVGGRLVPIGTLAELFAGRLEISSQHASQALLQGESQGRLLDHFGGLIPQRTRVEKGVAGLRERSLELSRLRADAEERARREDFLTFQVQEIDDADLAPDETEQCGAEHQRLVHAERLRSDTEAAAARLAGDPAVGDAPNAGDLLSEAARSVEGLGGLDPALAPLAERIAAAREELADVAAALERYAARIEADPARLERVEERIRQLEGLRRKYGRSTQEILAFRDRAAAELGELGGSDDRMRKLEAERDAEGQRVVGEVAQLSRGRQAAAKKLASAVQRALATLAMPDARFEVRLAPVAAVEGAPCGSAGAEVAEFLFSANPGESPQPLRRVASGGELSRVFLALKNVLRRSGAGMVLVFDEVDAGVGGRVAERVGGLLGSLAEHHQVLCITHLPQIAAQAQRHFRVHKQSDRGRTRTGLSLLDEAGRVEEIARMAAGETVSEATRRHARSLLAGASPKGSAKTKR